MKPNLPVLKSHNEVADLEVLFLPNRGGAIFYDERVRYLVVRDIRLSYFASTSRSSSPRESRTLRSRGSRPLLFQEVTKCEESSTEEVHTKEGENPDCDSRTSLENLPPG